MKSAEEIMNILEAYDLTGSLRDAGELAGCSHHTVARYVRAREEGRLVPGAASPRPGVIDGFLPKLEELVERSKGKIRADVAHEKITAMGYAGSERTTRRAVAGLKKSWHSGRRRVFRPWIPEPGMWAQYDFGDGPAVGGAATVLFCLWLAWSRFRVVLPLLDKTQPSVWAALDVALRRAGGVPAYLLTDNEKTVTVEHVAGVPVRNQGAVEFGRHYGLTVATCVPYDPASKGGSESTVKLAKADLVPTDANLLGEYGSFTALEAACAAFCEQVNARPHRVTRRAPAEMLADEMSRLHPVPAVPLTAALGVTRRVDAMSLVSFEGGRYSVPHQLAGQVVHVRRHGGHVVIAHAGPAGPGEVARHQATVPGSPRVDEAHYPPAPPGALNREPKARTRAEAEFLAIGNGAVLWLAEAAATGASRVRSKMAQAVQLAALHGTEATDRALGQAAASGRFADGDPGRDPRPPGARRARRAVPGRRGPHPRAGHWRLGPPRRQEGGRPVTTRKHDGNAVVLSEQDAAFIRQALIAASAVFAQAKAAGAPGYQALQEAALDVPGGRPLAGVHYDVCLAVDHLDFPPPVRSTR